MKIKLNVDKEDIIYFLCSGLFLLLFLELFFYKTGLLRIALISLKLSFLVHLPGFLIALKLFKDEFEKIGLLIIGFSFGLMNSALFYYLPTTLGINLNNITYWIPLFLLLIGFLLHITINTKKQEQSSA